MVSKNSILNDFAGRAWLASAFVYPAFAGEAEGGAGATDGSDGGDKGDDADAGAEGVKPSASGKGGRDSDGKDPALSALAKERATLQKNLQARTEERDRAQKKYTTVLEAIGGENELEEFRDWKGKQAKLEEERLRKEGDFEKLSSQLRNSLAEKDQKILGLELGILTKGIEQELLFAASPDQTDAVNPKQIVRLYAADFTLDTEEGSETHGQFVHRSLFSDKGIRMSAVEFLEQERSGAGSNLFRSTLKPGSGAGGDGDAVESGAVLVKMVGGMLAPDEQAKWDKAVADGRPAKIVHADAA